MYLWQITTLAPKKIVDATLRKRFLVTASERAEDAFDRARRIDSLSQEILQEITYIGHIPAIVETGLDYKPAIYYIQATYLYPPSGPGSTTTRIVPTSFLDRVDMGIAKALGVEGPIGSLPVTPRDAVDTSKIGAILALSKGDPQEARELLASHVFSGIIEPDHIFITHMSVINPPL